MTTGSSVLGDFGDWDVEVLRLSVFPSGQPPSRLWSQVVGSDPETTDGRPREGMAAESGPFLGNVLRVVTQPGRVDWVFQPTPPASGRTAAFSNVPESISALGLAFAQTLERISHIERLAFGVTLSKRVGSQSQGVQSLAVYLSELPLTPEILDFTYRVNRRRRLTSDPKIQVNRLATWSVQEIVSVALTIPQGNLDVRAPAFVRKLVLDINTVPSGMRTPDKVQPWFDELVVMAKEIAAEGDIK